MFINIILLFMVNIVPSLKKTNKHDNIRARLTGNSSPVNVESNGVLEFVVQGMFPKPCGEVLSQIPREVSWAKNGKRE